VAAEVTRACSIIGKTRKNKGKSRQKVPNERQLLCEKPRILAIISGCRQFRFIFEGIMNILLINPPGENVVAEFQDSKGKGFLEVDDFGKFPPLGALYVLSYAEKYLPDHHFYFLDCVAEKISHADLPERLAEIAPDIIGVTSFTISLMDAIKVAEAARDVVPGAHLCLGGHHATDFPLEAAKLDEFDSIVVGEGEQAFASLIENIATGKEITGIAGVYTRDTIEAHARLNVRDPRFRGSMPVPPAYIEDIDILPPPDRHHVAHINYHSVVGMDARLATMITSRGCPCKCTFCNVPCKQYRPRNLGLVMDEIEECRRMGYREFHFYDDLFNITSRRLEEFCLALKERNLSVVWDFRGRVTGVTRESLALAKSLGLRLIFFGVETGSDEGLRLLNKGCSIAQIRQAFQWCRELGIKTVADFMIGLPHEKSVDDVRENIDFLISLRPDYAQIGIMNLYPHTEIYSQAVEKGLVELNRWSEWAKNPTRDFRVEHWTEFLSEEELVRLHRESYRRFYFRLSYIMRSIVGLRSFHEFKSKVTGALKLLILQ